MSAYSDWKCGAITDVQYRQAYMMDRGEEHGEDDRDVTSAEYLLSLLVNRPCEACTYHKDTGCTRWSCDFDKVLEG